MSEQVIDMGAAKFDDGIVNNSRTIRYADEITNPTHIVSSNTICTDTDPDDNTMNERELTVHEREEQQRGRKAYESLLIAYYGERRSNSGKDQELETGGRKKTADERRKERERKIQEKERIKNDRKKERIERGETKEQQKEREKVEKQKEEEEKLAKIDAEDKSYMRPLSFGPNRYNLVKSFLHMAPNDCVEEIFSNDTELHSLERKGNFSLGMEPEVRFIFTNPRKPSTRATVTRSCDGVISIRNCLVGV